MNFDKPDGAIEIGTSGCCCPPGQRRPGQHTNSTTRWWRAVPAEWQRVPDNMNLVRLARESVTVAAFTEAIE